MIRLESFVKNMRRFKILIAGGEAAERRHIRNILQTLGFSNFREVEDGDAAWRKLRVEKFDFIVCDWSMPLVNGFGLLRAVRGQALNVDTPFLMIVSPLEEKEAAQRLNPGEDGYLVKPLLPQKVEDKMIEILFNNLKPTPYDIHVQAAGAALAQGDLALAHEELDRAEQINQRRPMTGYFRSLVFEAGGRPDRAEAAAAQARETFAAMIKGPRQADRLIRQGSALLAEGRIEEARQVFDLVFQFDPDNPNRQHEIGDAFLNQGLAEEAEKIFKASIESNPDDVFLYNRLGMAFRRQKKFEEAIANYQKALSIDPDEENLHYNLARAYLAAGDRPKAAECLARALDLAPDFREARELLERIA